MTSAPYRERSHCDPSRGRVVQLFGFRPHGPKVGPAKAKVPPAPMASRHGMRAATSPRRRRIALLGAAGAGRERPPRRARLPSEAGTGRPCKVLSRPAERARWKGFAQLANCAAALRREAIGPAGWAKWSIAAGSGSAARR
jgi:hypothetical protein